MQKTPNSCYFSSSNLEEKKYSYMFGEVETGAQRPASGEFKREPLTWCVRRCFGLNFT